MPILIQSFKISNFRKVKRGCGRFGISANLEWFKVCFLSSEGQYATFATPQAYSVQQFFQKIVFRQISQTSKFLPFGRNSAIWKLQHVLFLAQGANTLLLVAHMSNLKQSFKISKFRNIKKGVAVLACLKFWHFVIMITKHHIELIQVSNSLYLKMTTGPLWGLLV